MDEFLATTGVVLKTCHRCSIKMAPPYILVDKQEPEPSSKPTIVVAHTDYTVGQTTGGLSVIFTVMCIIDLFGVFPVITLPKSILSCGIYGVPLVLGVFGLQLYTAVLLGRSWLLAQEITPHIIEKNRYPYAAIAELAFGTSARRLVTFLIDATVFGSGIPNFILAAQSLQIFCWKVTGGQVGISYCIWMLFLALLLCPIMWLGSPKDMKPLAFASVCIVSTVAICTWTCILTDNESPPSIGGVMMYKPRVQDFLIAYGILAFQFDIHPMLLTIQVDMKDSKKINSAVLGGFAVTGFMFAVTTLLAAHRYGIDLSNNVLRDIPPSIPLYVVALLVTLQLCLSSAVSNSALFQHIEDLLKVPRSFCIGRCLVRSTIIIIALFLAESVPRFDLVMGLVGSTLTGPLMFILPPLLFLKLCYIKSNLDIDSTYLDNKNTKRKFIEKREQNGVENGRQNRHVSKLTAAFQTKYKTFMDNYNLERKEHEYTMQWYDILIALIVMTMGIAATIVATFSSWSNSIEYAEYSPPCLVNATFAARSFLQNSFGIS
ncbi:hypothetical protein K1T71_012958 [Dendrolimus kikuchii]|uniref:Uncharacterized protein n=1 Tax=Dendrolimus kikuchii TaxID=765133 RepID=A0ACC1CIJ8_9NEOP|nr:hypothetical protein K1T71_012958 [Dendrolimus kikuchii]